MAFLRKNLMAATAILAGTITLAFASEKIRGDPSKALPIVTEACAACHGQDGNSPIPNFPKLAGQTPEYLLRELREFKLEHRQSEMMAPFIAKLSDEDMANLALYFAAQKPIPAEVTKPELITLGKKIYDEGNPDSGVPSCEGCHGENGAGSTRFPRIAGQSVEYTLEQIKLYSAQGRKHGMKLMRVVAERLTEQEAEALAQYLASLN
jgi:cytochrome c553